jgi:hypothetical protein
MKRMVGIVLLLAGAAYAQDIKPLTPEETVSIRDPQVRALTAASNMEAAKAAFAAAQTEFNTATEEAQKAVEALYAARKISPKEVAFCTGSAANGPCANAPANKLSLQPVPKENAEAKKP